MPEAFSKRLNVIGFDVNSRKIEKLRSASVNPKITFTDNSKMLLAADYTIICVPTPVTKSKEPDLSYITGAARVVRQNLKKGSVVILESTVYPGVTEDIVSPILEKESGLKCGADFKVGYSPERINSGDSDHVIDTITKVVAGINLLVGQIGAYHNTPLY